jgi:hypothetical protein
MDLKQEAGRDGILVRDIDPYSMLLPMSCADATLI